MADDSKLDFLRVLIAAAWADGNITCDEMNNLKSYFQELSLRDDELTALEPYFADPIEPSEAQTIIDDFLARARRGERETILAAVRDLVLTDGKLAAGESEFLELFQDSGEPTTTGGVFVARLKRLWAGAGTADRDDRFRRSDLIDEFIKNRVFYQIKRRLMLATGGADLDPETERELRYVCALGALLGHVAGADQNFDAEERAAIAEILDSISALQPRDVDILVDIVQSEVLSDVGYFDFVREINELAGRDERIKIVGLLFEVAAADGEISHSEHEEIRKIAKALNVEHEEFIAAKLAARPSEE